MTSLPDPEHYFKFGNLMKNAIFSTKVKPVIIKYCPAAAGEGTPNAG